MPIPLLRVQNGFLTVKNSEAKNLHLISLGCPKNKVDAEMMLGQMLKNGYQMTEEPEKAHTIVVNTCSFIDEAQKESVQNILDVAELKKTGQLQKLVVSGCLVQRYKSDLVEELPEVDAFVGSGEFQNIHKILKKDQDKKDFFHLPTFLQQEDTPRVNSEPFYRAYLKISEGCLKRCSFCAIPKIRGNLQSRPVTSIINEAKLLVAGGVHELNVISHDFTDYGWDLRRQDKKTTDSPYSLLKSLSEVEGLDWIRLLYLYPDGLDDKILSLIRDKPNLIPYFDMPLQHINDHMLKLMNRQMTGSEIRKVLHKIRHSIPEAVIRTQFIVGFPGETEAMFEELLAFIEEQRFDRVGCFTYSPQEGTAGFKLKQTVDEETKQRRLHELMSLQMEISREKHQSYIGQKVEVVVDGPSEETELLLQGRMATQAPEIDGVVLINEGQAKRGEKLWVQVTDSHDYDLIGRILQPISLFIFCCLSLLPTARGTELIGALSAGQGGTGRAAIEASEALYLNPASIALMNRFYTALSYQSGATGDTATNRRIYSLTFTDATPSTLLPGALGYRHHRLQAQGFEFIEHEFKGALGYRLHDRVALGLGGSYLKAQAQGSGGGPSFTQSNMDVGLLLGLQPNWGFSLTGENLLPSPEELPPALKRISRVAMGTQYIFQPAVTLRYEVLMSLHTENAALAEHRFGLAVPMKGRFSLHSGLSLDDGRNQRWTSLGIAWRGPRLQWAYSAQREDGSGLGYRHLIDLWVDL